jgi:hypothetical protein
MTWHTIATVKTVRRHMISREVPPERLHQCVCPNLYGDCYSPLLSLSGRAISRSFISQSIQAILLQKLGCCICY